MQTVGQILKNKRTSSGLSLKEAQENLRISKEYLSALERDDFSSLPSVPYIRGFIRNYSIFLGLDETKTQAIFRRQFDAANNQKIVPRGVARPLDEPIFKITPQRAAVGAGVVVILLFLLYLASQMD